ncbi:SulP family inorganic anion transporter [Pseudogemmatithrix spongiicola]|uniref:SulP family inorganic anion transporter n=1 Tax=Pseudogemmatithrix spongiicola TaxID=3062599 RepID=A0AA49JYW7_9BACT|nr:SulP family inorganic anion transporter [Gemmatimonadaceae bacterium 'strain 138']WKW14496.1 SulP family inorganic anion transporter [Gemmatimonadaceae bacterium 'strain 318']
MPTANMFAYPRQDAVAGFVVFLVALPLCLGIAIASGAPPVSGLVAGAVGGLVVPWISRSPLSVTGPAAGLTAIVLAETQALGSFELFLTATLVAGVLQAGLGFLRSGRFAALVPSAVIKGMLAAIGITIVWKQLPVAVGAAGLADLATSFNVGAALLTLLSLVILYGWRHTPLAKIAVLSPAMVVVLLTSVLAAVFSGVSGLALAPAQFVDVPIGGATALLDAMPRPDWSGFGIAEMWVAAVTVAVVASIETLLSLQAIDRLDPLRRSSPPDRELIAQGTANAVSGFLGGLPVTAVIVRSGANLAAGGRERMSALVHGVLLVVAVVYAAPLLTKIPLAALAAVLIQVGLNLCKPALFSTQVKLGWTQFAPFALTIAAVLALDLLKGVIVGIIVGIAFVLYQNSRGAIVQERSPSGQLLLRFRRDGTFLSKPAIVEMLEAIPDGERVLVDGTGEYIDHDVKEVLASFLADAPRRSILVTVTGIDLSMAAPGGGH